MAKKELTIDQGEAITWLAEPELKSYDELHLGEVLEVDNLCSELHGYLGEAPVALNASAVAELLGIEKAPWKMLETAGKKSWFIKNTFAVDHVSGLVEPGAVGIEITYRDNAAKINSGQKVHIHSVFPAPEFRIIAEVNLEGRGQVEGTFEFKANLVPPGVLAPVAVAEVLGAGTPVELDATAGLRASAVAQGHFNLSAKFFTPIISAIGVGDTRAQWCFHRNGGPFIGKDVATWTGLILGNEKKKLNYEARIFLIFKLGFFQFRRYSPWTKLSCELVDEG